MSKQINLLTVSKQYRQKERYFSYFRVATLFLGVAVFVSILGFFVLTQSKKKQTTELEAKIKASETEASLIAKQVAVATRIAETEKTVSASTSYRPLYDIVTSNTTFDSGVASLESLEIDSQKNLDLRVNFFTKESLLSFLSLIETPQFSDNFKSIIVNDVDVTAAGTGTTELLLKALFDSHENKN